MSGYVIFSLLCCVPVLVSAEADCVLPVEGEFSAPGFPDTRLATDTIYILGDTYSCDRRADDNDTFILRAKRSNEQDLLMCLRFTRLTDDTLVMDFLTDGLVQLVSTGLKQTVQTTCDAAGKPNKFVFFSRIGRTQQTAPCPEELRGYWEFHKDYDCSSEYQVDGCELLDTLATNTSTCSKVPARNDTSRQVCMYARAGATTDALSFLIYGVKEGKDIKELICMAYKRDAGGAMVSTYTQLTTNMMKKDDPHLPCEYLTPDLLEGGGASVLHLVKPCEVVANDTAVVPVTTSSTVPLTPLTLTPLFLLAAALPFLAAL